MCEQNGNKLVKLTEIILNNKVYLIQDVFIIPSQIIPESTTDNQYTSKNEENSKTYNDKSTLSNESLHKKNHCIFKKQNKCDSILNNRNTKNIAKNFCKAFISHVK